MSSKKDKKLKGFIRFSLKESVSLHEILKMAHIRKFLDERNYENSSIARWKNHLD